jgi:hypothetical protein
MPFEEDMMPRNICGNCLATSTRANPVRHDARTDRRLCRSCEPHPWGTNPDGTERPPKRRGRHV